MTQIALKRVYEPIEPTDGWRVLVDRLWPRGVAKAKAHFDGWAKDLAPSPELREWFHEDREGRWNEFVKKYEAELEASNALKQFEAKIADKPKVTLLYASKDEAHNQADVLADLLRKHYGKSA